LSSALSQSGSETHLRRRQLSEQGTEKGGRGISAIEREVEQLAPGTEQEQDDKEALMHYTATIRAVLQLKGQAPYQLAGLEAYETLARIDTSVTHCLQNHPHPLLEKIQTLAQRRHEWDEAYHRIRRRQEWVLGLSEILDVSRTAQGWYTQAGVEVAQEMEQFLDGLVALKDAYPDDTSFIDHILRRTEAWAPGLFSCYEQPAIPRTNNDLEQYNGTLKHQQRRITGRKATADYITRHGPYVVFFDPDESDEQVLARFRQVSATAFREERERFIAAQACQRRIRSFRRDADRFLLRAELLWCGDDP
jgi:hypothetical protein